jgi:hypothetical protein
MAAPDARSAVAVVADVTAMHVPETPISVPTAISTAIEASDDADDAPTDAMSYVPTATIEKPTDDPTPQHQPVDTASGYEHRFDSPSPDFTIPGEPIRSQAASPFDINSGAFHGVRAVNGWSALRVEVSIPCGSSRFSQRAGFNEVTGTNGPVDSETGYVYIGGWGAGPRGVPVDAGLQKSSAQAARDAYAVYWKYGRNHPKTLSTRYPCDGPDVTLELYPVTDTLLVFSASGVDDAGNYRTQTIVQRTSPDDGWVPSGGSRTDGIILKRLISIAQPASWKISRHADRWKNKSYFGVRSEVDRTPTVIWRSCSIGHVVPPSIVPTYRPWGEEQTWQPRGLNVYADWPEHAVVSRALGGVCDAAGIALM